jgi:hypothetical protein
MKLKNDVNTLVFRNLSINVAETASEFDQLAKKEGACVESANNNTLYRSVLAQFRGNFLHGIEAVGKEGDEKFVPGLAGVEQITGIERKTEGTGKFRGEGESKEEVMVYAETEDKYFKRVLAELVLNKSTITIEGAEVGPFDSVEAAGAAFNGLAQAHLDRVPFDPSVTERAPSGPKKIAKVYIDVAKKLIAAGKADAAAADLSSRLGITVEATEDGLSRAISEDQRRKREAVGNEYGV